MSTIAVLLCALMMQVTSQTNVNVSDISPARILAQQKTVSENSDLHLTCSTFGFKKVQMVYVYLCKEGVGTSVLMQKHDQNDTVFIIPRVGRHHSGNYSCVYSKTKYSAIEVAKTGHNTIQILVIANFLPGDISFAGPSTVSEGDNVEFRCTLSETLQTLGECHLIQSYLRNNKSILQVQAFNVTRMEATFTIESAVMRDSGHYSCVLLPSKCIENHDTIPYGNNAVFIEVRVSLFVRVIISCGVIGLMLLLGACLWLIRNKQGQMIDQSVVYNSCAASQQPSANVFEEPQEQTEGVDLESLDRESLNSEEEEWNENDSPYYDDCEEQGVYSMMIHLQGQVQGLFMPNPSNTSLTGHLIFQ
ncbi:uncharacterized protein [Channa argus]|uniref:uncharacterized protein isoform X2 n=1 Tax=Channa argus TaxID=215402 RepID=UPI0035204EC7